MIERHINLEKYMEASSLYGGGVVINLGPEKLTEIAHVVSSELALRPTTMIGYSEEELIQSMIENRAVVMLDVRGKPSAFAQFWPYEIDNTGDEQSLTGKTVFEIGSWLSFSNNETGKGRTVFKACLAIGKMLHPDAIFIGIVEENNARAAGILENMGGKAVGSKVSLDVKGLDAVPAKMIIYDMNPKE